jgi:ABC-2 type transport system ATP-binding protein
LNDVMIRARRLEKRYGEAVALATLDWDLQAGSITGILGPNGAGKTTLAKLVLGITRPSAGSVSVLGADVSADPARARRVLGFLPEEKTFHGTLRSAAFLRYYGAFFPDFDASAGLRLLDGWGIPPDAKTRDLSKGSRAKLALAAVLARKPRILLLDEPTLDLDPASIEEVLSLVAGWAAGGDRAVAFTTHRLTDVDRVCDRVLCLVEGRAVANEDLEDLKARWRRLRVAGSAPPDEVLRSWAEVRGVSRGEGWASLTVDREHHEVVRRLEESGANSVGVEELSLREIYLSLVNHNRGRLDGVLESLA